MSGMGVSRRITAVLVVLPLLLAAPLGAPAVADAGRVDVSVLLDSTELMAVIDGGPAPSAPPDILYEVFDAAAAGQVPVDTRTAPGGFGEVASFSLDDGRYKIRASAPGFLASWYTGSSGGNSDAFLELLGYQARKTFATADEIVVDSTNPANSTWSSQGWTVLHTSSSSISGAVGNVATGQAGSLLADVAVELYNEAAPGSVAAATTRTDANGYYTFPNQGPGAYKVRFVAGGVERWWPETPHRAEAEAIILDGANHFNLAYAVFPDIPAGVDPHRLLTVSGELSPGATLTAVPDYIEVGPGDKNCLQRYSWFIGTVAVPGAFGPTFVVPPAAAGQSVTARLDMAGLACTYTALQSSAVGPMGPAAPGLTIPGTGVVVAPEDSAGGTDVTLSFENVTAAGITTVTRLESGDAFPDGGFSSLTDPPLYYDIETTAEFNAELGVEVCITFATTGMTAEQAAGQRLYHFVDEAWKDITLTSDAGKVCGLTTSFSPFAVGQPKWPFHGFLQPVDNGGILNAMKAGAAVPIRFGLGGNRGLGILAAGAPSSSVVSCPGGTTPDVIEQTVAAGTSPLSYGAASDTYTFVWKTQKAWAGSCRQFELRLNDGTVHRALFDFRR